MAWRGDPADVMICGSVTDLSEGVFVTPNVRLSHPIAEGGMGSVWAANHLGLDAPVAVKFIRADAVKREPNLIDRFRSEATISAKMRSPHAVQVFDHGTMDDGTPYIVMEMLEGEDLQERLESEGLTDAEAVTLVSQLARVLERAHKLGIVHRDLKPANVYLANTGYELFVKVLDFGVAKESTLSNKRMTSTGAMVGTPLYMSPELIESAKDADRYSDLWALAVIAYEVLTGEAPFDGETLGALCIAISKGVYHPPSSVRPDLAKVDPWVRAGAFP